MPIAVDEDVDLYSTRLSKITNLLGSYTHPSSRHVSRLVSEDMLLLQPSLRAKRYNEFISSQAAREESNQAVNMLSWVISFTRNISY
jgi:hypothetical protein